MNPDLILGVLLDRHVDPVHRTGEMAEAFCNWLRPPLTELLEKPEFINKLAPAIWATALGDLDHIRQTTDRLEQQFLKTSQELGLAHGLVISLARRIATDVPDFDTLRAVWLDWYEKGRDKGLALELEVEVEVAIALAQHSCEVAVGADQIGVGLNDLGTALATLGERESDTARLQEAVQAYHNALTERTQGKVPLEWAATQFSLGNALSILGQCESGTARLDQAVEAYHNALTERTQDRVPMDWAMTQGNLGGTHLTYFDKTGDPAHLEIAETHLRAALALFEQAAPHYAGMEREWLQQIAARRAQG